VPSTIAEHTGREPDFAEQEVAFATDKKEKNFKIWKSAYFLCNAYLGLVR
jgi:hypothetical protein